MSQRRIWSLIALMNSAACAMFLMAGHIVPAVLFAVIVIFNIGVVVSAKSGKIAKGRRP